MARNNRVGSARALVGWAERIKRWRGSGLSKLAWCRAHGVSYTQLIRWCKRLEAEGPLVPVKLIPLSARIAAQATLTLRLPGGMSIEVGEGFDAGLLGAVVRALSESSAC